MDKELHVFESEFTDLPDIPISLFQAQSPYAKKMYISKDTFEYVLNTIKSKKNKIMTSMGPLPYYKNPVNKYLYHLGGYVRKRTKKSINKLKGGYEEYNGYHQNNISLTYLNEIIHKNFPINILPWIGEQNDEYFCIIDGLNFMDGGAKRGIEDILVNNLIKLLDQIYPYDRRKRPVKIIVTYRGHIEDI